MMCTVASELWNDAICQLIYLLRKDTVAIKQDVLMFWKPVNFIAEMQGCHALKQFVRKGGMSFSRISHSRCLGGSVM